MKLRTWVVGTAAGCLLLAGCDMFGGGEGEAPEGGEVAVPAEGGSGPAPEAGSGPAPEAKPAEAPPPAPDATPAGACTAWVDAAKASDTAKMETLSTAALKDMLANEAGKTAMLESLKDATCGEAKVEGDKAMVPVKAGETARDTPFVKEGEAWKFDAAAYAEKYPPEAKGKGKKAKKGAKNKKKG